VGIDSKYDGDPSLAGIGVVYLYRFAEGELPVRTFLHSYRAHPAGVDHDLHVIFKGFADRRSIASARALFASLPINPIELEDTGYDIGSYFAAAKAVTNQRLIFFNTFTELLADDWLKKFDAALSLPGVGLVGATGSWQSLSSYYEVILHHGWHEIRRPPDYLRKSSPGGQQTTNVRDIAGNEEDLAIQKISKIDEHSNIVRIGRALYLLLRFDKYILYLYNYGRYPNPHVRTNAFMIETDRFVSLHSTTFKTKFDVYKFESGRRSMTKQIMAQGLKPVVVDRNGDIYNISQWKSSSTFWVDQQNNLLVADNQTRDYAKGSRELRRQLEDHAWVHPSSWRLKVHRLWIGKYRR
jgi:hypothetical protein